MIQDSNTITPLPILKHLQQQLAMARKTHKQFAGQDQSGMNGLNSQMANMGIGAPSNRRKKERHAYHDLNSSTPNAAAPPPMGTPAPGFQPGAQILATRTTSTASSQSRFTEHSTDERW
ncbi:hypothetical protein MRB53_040931 [Persea americana]|nr:hypothetical protein MRB53_040931 [Persea americana]